MRRKGQMLLLLAVLIVGLAIVYFLLQGAMSPAVRELPSVRERHQAANSYVISLEHTILPRILLSSATAALRTMIEDVRTQGYLIDEEDVGKKLTRLMIEGRTGASSDPLHNRTLPFQLELLANLTNETMHIIPVFENPKTINISILQDKDTGPWQVRLEARIPFYLNTSIAYWRRNATITTNMSIIGMLDPYHLGRGLGEGSKLEIPIVQVQRPPERSLGNFLAAIETTQYFHDPGAPCFMDRLMGNDRIPIDAACGIAAILSTSVHPDLSAQVNSFVDYCFFREANSIGCKNPLWQVKGVSVPSGTHPGFLLDLPHIRSLNLNECGLRCDLAEDEDGRFDWNCENVPDLPCVSE